MKTILITGSNRGIGFEIARQCARKNMHIIISGRDENKLQKALKLFAEENLAADALLMDVSDAGSIRKAAANFSKLNLRLDVLVNNAGIGIRGDMNLSSDDEHILTASLLTNSYGPLRVTKAFLPFMQFPGRIIMISSGGVLCLTNPEDGGPHIVFPKHCSMPLPVSLLMSFRIKILL